MGKLKTINKWWTNRSKDYDAFVYSDGQSDVDLDIQHLPISIKHNEAKRKNGFIISVKKESFEITWKHIINAIKHEIGNKRDTMLLNILQNDKYDQINIDDSPQKNIQNINGNN